MNKSKTLSELENKNIQQKINTYVGETYVNPRHVINRYDKVRSRIDQLPKRRFVKVANGDIHIIEDDLKIEDLENS